MKQQDLSQERLLPMGQMRERYSVSNRTIERWLEAEILPQPVRLGQNRFWRLSDLERIERDRVGIRPDNTSHFRRKADSAA